MKNISAHAKAAIGAVFIMAAAMPAQADVKVSYSDTLEKYHSALDRVELGREETFRKFRTDRGRGASIRPRDYINKSRFSGTEWGNERAIPEIENFSVDNLIVAMFERGIHAAKPDFDGDILVHVDHLRVRNHSVSILSSFNTFMEGTVTLLDADGKVVAKEKVKAYPTRNFTVSRSYKGSEYAYRTGSLNTRVGPIFANFSEAALEKLFPEYDAPGFILVED
ncbi:hypothetical protein [Kordiimonas laminariae]|uniref:hypothetical protein n=1 Tax=Kordiimonas laminariae TaxID=2917717 RepID=UPI001FF5FC5A|nr:hypothetical protein [Kordiimonas laminariae]MCK0067916.1 hypothetical protein [Kordiimonas laminariae]